LAKAAAGDRAHVALAVPGQRYEGVVIGSTERYLVQESKGHAGELFLHSRRALLNADLVVPGPLVEIRDPHGGVGLVEASPPHPERENPMPQQRDREFDR